MENDRVTGNATTKTVFAALGKHFVTLSCNYIAPGKGEADEQALVASGFVVELRGEWLYVTAGHVIEAIQRGIQAGGTFTHWRFGDQTAGSGREEGIPYDFNLDGWSVLNDEDAGHDYAVVSLEGITRRNLEVGGVVPLDKSTWELVPLDYFDELVLVGVAADTVTYERTGLIQAKTTLIPLKRIAPPETAEAGAKENKFFAELDSSAASLTDLQGMSGGPIFGIKKGDGGRRYWGVGVQSGWYEQRRIISACPLSPFMLTLEAAGEVAEKKDQEQS